MTQSNQVKYEKRLQIEKFKEGSMKLTKTPAPTYTADIYIAGDLADINRACREFCEIGLCVTVTPTNFIYTGGSQTGARVGLINYPKFPQTVQAIRARALELAEDLVLDCYQDSCSVVFPDETIYIQREGLK